MSTQYAREVLGPLFIEPIPDTDTAEDKLAAYQAGWRPLRGESCGFCDGVVIFVTRENRYVHAENGERVSGENSGDLSTRVLAQTHNTAGTTVPAFDVWDADENEELR